LKRKVLHHELCFSDRECSLNTWCLHRRSIIFMPVFCFQSNWTCRAFRSKLPHMSSITKHYLVIDWPCVTAIRTLIKDSLPFIDASQLYGIKSHLWCATFHTRFFHNHSLWFTQISQCCLFFVGFCPEWDRSIRGCGRAWRERRCRVGKQVGRVTAVWAPDGASGVYAKGVVALRAERPHHRHGYSTAKGGIYYFSSAAGQMGCSCIKVVSRWLLKNLLIGPVSVFRLLCCWVDRSRS